MRAHLGSDGLLRFDGGIARATLGQGGIVSHKQEGDGATPCGTLALRRVLYRADRVSTPRASVPVEPIAPQDGWCDDPSHQDYNRPIRVPHPARHERLWRDDALYDVIGVLGWNDWPVRPGFGSAIFLHVARPDYAPTQGCVALALPDLLAVLASGLSAIEIGRNSAASG